MTTLTTLLVLLGIAVIAGFAGATIIWFFSASTTKTQTRVEITLVKRVRPDEDKEEYDENGPIV